MGGVAGIRRGGTQDPVVRDEGTVGFLGRPALRYRYFLLDEAFAVGDKDFKSKYEEVFRNHKSDGSRTYVIATHDLEFARLFCTKTLWLQKGKLMAFGDTKAVLERYISPEPLELAS